uniref:Mitotic spindle assembly checkpoint protein MAD1 n=1 Tax=Erpetoichthys calabaricus TaxID=27687 RepID=A0A8C4XAM1_ERPCA
LSLPAPDGGGVSCRLQQLSAVVLRILKSQTALLICLLEIVFSIYVTFCAPDAHSFEEEDMFGDYDPTKTKVIHFKMNPSSVAKQQRVEDIQQLREECERLREHIRTAQALGTLPKDETALTLPPPQEVIALRKQIESSELMNQRLKEIFQKKIQEFRTVCYTLTGYQIDFTTENQYRLISMYAENTDDCLLFKVRNFVVTAVFFLKMQKQDYVHYVHYLFENMLYK